jgi:hypothetical protein
VPAFEELPLNCCECGLKYLAVASCLWVAELAAVAGQAFEIAFVYDRLHAQLRLLEVVFASPLSGQRMRLSGYDWQFGGVGFFATSPLRQIVPVSVVRSLVTMEIVAYLPLVAWYLSDV